MAAILMSATESVQVSAILEQQMSEQLKQHNPEEYKKYQQRQQQQQHQQQGIGTMQQLLLVAILFSIEMGAALVQIYSVPIVQYLDVPLALVSVNGVIAGACSVLLLPLVGYFTDRGSNPKARKICTVLISMGSFIMGLTLLASCGIIKILNFNDYLSNTENSTVNSIDTIGSGTRIDSRFESVSNQTGELTMTLSSVPTTPLEPDLNLDSLPVTVFMSILGFALIDIGFDTSTSLTRAFVLETIPSFQHTNILVLATVIQSSAGTTLSAAGCFDLPGYLGPAFHTDGTAAMIIFLAILLTFFIIVCSTTTITTAVFLDRRQKQRTNNSIKSHYDKYSKSECESAKTNEEETSQRENPKHGNSRVHDKSGTAGTEQKTLRKIPKFYPRPSRGARLQKSKAAEQEDKKPFVADILHTEEGDSSTRPLLFEDSLKGNHYAAIIGTTSGNLPPPASVEGDSVRAKFRIGRQDSVTSENNEGFVLEDSNADAHSDDDNDEDERNSASMLSTMVGVNAATLMAALKRSYSMSVSIVQPPLGDFHTRKITQMNAGQRAREEEIVQKRNNIFKRQLTFLSVATFFTYGGLIGFAIYSSNALTLGIFKGDPTAPVGSIGRERYVQGLQTSSMGSVVLYGVNFVASLTSSRVIRVIGEKLQFLVVCSLYIVMSLVLVLTERVEMYFVYMSVCGLFRSVIFSTPYILAQKFAQERVQCGTSTSSAPSIQFGKIMTLIGFLLPLHYAGMSLFLGPLMEATGNVFAPTLYSMVSTVLAISTFVPLFFIKNQI